MSEIIVLGLGNELFGDDGVGIAVAREVRKKVEIEVEETSESGFALLDYIVGKRKVIIIDGIKTGKFKPGKIITFSAEDLRVVRSPSPHYAGIPLIIASARNMGLEMPDEIRIVAVEVEDPYRFGEGLSPKVKSAVKKATNEVLKILERWRLKK